MYAIRSYYEKYIQDAGDEEIARQNKMVAEYATGITACSVGYYLAHKASFPDKTTYIPLPLNTDLYPYVSTIQPDVEKVHFFLGKQKGREVRKGVDVMERVRITSYNVCYTKLLRHCIL